MRPLKFNRVMHNELAILRRDELIDATLYQELLQAYPTTGWNWLSLGRWLLIFGAIGTSVGLFFLGQEFFQFTLKKAAIACGLVMGCAFIAGHFLRRRQLFWTAQSTELLGGLLLIALSFLVGAIYSSGSGNWPALLLIDMIILLLLTYSLNNVLLLVLSLVTFFTWFGGVTGYASGWGAYWFGMNYPLRFLLAGLAIAAIGIAHRVIEHHLLTAFRGFFKVWLSAGLFFCEMALWLMSLFGNFGEIWNFYRSSTAELWLFNLCWAGFNILLLYLGARTGLRMVRGYAITYLIIQGYTLFFWQIAGHLGPIVSTFIGGAATLALIVHLEQRRRAAKTTPINDSSD